MEIAYRRILMVMAAALTVIILSPQVSAQGGYGMRHGMMGYGDPGEGWQYCPYCGSRFDQPDNDGWGPGYHHRGSGRWGPGGYGRGPQMMRPDYDRPYEYRNDRRYRGYEEPLDEEAAKKVVSEMLDRSRNPNLKVGDIKDKKDYFVVDILTKNGALVDKMQVDKESGRMRSKY